MWGDSELKDEEGLDFFEWADQTQQIQQTENKGTVVYTIEGVHFELLPHFKPQKFVGRGSFGIVW